MLVNSNPELTLSQNLSEPLHKSRASSDRSDAHFAQSGEEKKLTLNHPKLCIQFFQTPHFKKIEQR